MKKKVVMICLPLALLATLAVAFAAFAHPIHDGTPAGAILAAQTNPDPMFVATYAPAEAPSSSPAIITQRAPVISASGVAPTVNENRVVSDSTIIRSGVKPLWTGKSVVTSHVNFLVMNSSTFSLPLLATGISEVRRVASTMVALASDGQIISQQTERERGSYATAENVLF